MSDDPSSNAATDWLRRAYGAMRSAPSAPQWPLTDDFVYEDWCRRGGVNFGRLDAAAWARMMDTFWQPGGGQADFEIVAVIAVRGERSTAVHAHLHYGEIQSNELIQCVRLDEKMRRMERFVEFDVDDRDAAIAELDRMHAEIEG